MISAPRRTLFGWSNEEGWNKRDIWHGWATEEVSCLPSVGEEASKIEHFYHLDVGEKTVLKWILKEFDQIVWAGMIRIRTGTNKMLFFPGNETLALIKCEELLK